MVNTRCKTKIIDKFDKIVSKFLTIKVSVCPIVVYLTVAFDQKTMPFLKYIERTHM